MTDLKARISFHLPTTKNNNLYLTSLFWASVLFFIFAAPLQSVQADSDKKYIRVESSELYEKSDLQIISIGLLGLSDTQEGHIDLTYLESDENGKGLTFDAGGGIAYKWYASFYAGLGVAMGYNFDNDDTLITYYPEVGIVLDVTKSFGISISRKRYFNLDEKTDDIIMLGLVFR